MNRVATTAVTLLLVSTVVACGRIGERADSGFDTAPDACELVSVGTVEELVGSGATTEPFTPSDDTRSCTWQTGPRGEKTLMVQARHLFVHPTDSASELGRVHVDNRYGRDPRYEKIEVSGPPAYRDTQQPGTVHTHVDNVLLTIFYVAGTTKGEPPTFVPAPGLNEDARRIANEAVQALDRS
ncbi:hypothetical protein GIY23_19440 [Allosaccharopolyspora coralli]|uniref:DUF3558 domain-containing protein n=1 Tax=Allosaccharopolyspora coralli TaxID=2665642 RepID=A0A5Q3QA02_9PSEU|nr:hypothetical protein [Allosaccharopolyspora coralli]QGK71398.1 hypothetical protein GIY23_19440 [Allosaccharopolyspora coralli]